MLHSTTAVEHSSEDVQFGRFDVPVLKHSDVARRRIRSIRGGSLGGLNVLGFNMNVAHPNRARDPSSRMEESCTTHRGSEHGDDIREAFRLQLRLIQRNNIRNDNHSGRPNSAIDSLTSSVTRERISIVSSWT